MTDLLFLVHRLPYPPNKGDKIRSYHLLQHLLKNYSVHLGCFVDEDESPVDFSELRQQCASLRVFRLRPELAKLRSLRGLVRRSALSIPYYADRSFAGWVSATVRTNGIRSILAFSSQMAQYVLGSEYAHCRRVMDFVDVDSDKWKQYADRSPGPVRWLYAREARLLCQYERSIARAFDAVTFVSQHETALFDSLSPESSGKHFTIRNGVDYRFFDPNVHFESPFNTDSEPLVFTGMMNYWPNVDAMCWFARELLPAIRTARPNAELWIVGASPQKEITALASMPGVTVTGRVEDVRPFLRHAAAVVAPLRIARGVQNKVLEALAMNCTVVCTAEAAAGLESPSAAPLRIARTGKQIVDDVIRALEQDADRSGRSRQYVLRHYDWERNLAGFDTLLEGRISSDATVASV